MHAAAYHIQHVLDNYRNAKQFSGQGENSSSINDISNCNFIT